MTSRSVPFSVMSFPFDLRLYASSMGPFVAFYGRAISTMHKHVRDSWCNRKTCVVEHSCAVGNICLVDKCVVESVSWT